MDENYEELSTGNLNIKMFCLFLVANQLYLLSLLKDSQKANKGFPSNSFSLKVSKILAKFLQKKSVLSTVSGSRPKTLLKMNPFNIFTPL